MLFFQPLFLYFRPMILCHVMHHVTMVTCLFIVQKIKEIEKKKNRKIKSKKIDKKIKKIKIKYKSLSIP